MPPRGVIAAGHPVTAAVGADVLRDGGNAVDAALAAVMASFNAEPGLTGLGGGGYLLVVTPAGEVTLLDFFVEAPGRGADPARRAELLPIAVVFGDVTQMFHAGPSSCGVYGLPAGLCTTVERFGTMALADLAAPAARLAREGVPVNASQAYVIDLLKGIVTSTPECAAIYAPGGALLREGDAFCHPELGDALERLGAEGSEPFYSGDIASAVADWLEARDGMVTREDLRVYEAIDREPVLAHYGGREVRTNPPPSAGGILISHALGRLERQGGDPSPVRIVEAMAGAQAERTPEFLAGLAEDGFLERFLAARRGGTTHISVIDADGWAAGVTCSNGEGSGVVVPGTGLHVNNMLGEDDLNPSGPHHHPPGRRLPSMMCPTAVLRDGRAEVVLGSGGSNRIRSAILQTMIGAIDRGLGVDEAVRAPRLHFEDGIVYCEPGADSTGLAEAGYTLEHFRAPNLFFGGVQAVRRDPVTGALSGGADPRRDGAVVVV